MILLFGFAVIAIISGLVVFKSKKSIRGILAEVKYEIIYNLIGSKSMLEDLLMRKKNVTKLYKQTGKTAIITGGTRGIGIEVIKMLLHCDINIIIGCRKVEAGEKLFTELRSQGITTGDMKVFPLDTSSLKSVRKFADTIKQKYSKLEILINHAGIMYVPYTESEDGFESQFATNYLGHFLLTHLLLPLLEKGGNQNKNARIVNVASCAYLTGDINFNDINNKNNYIAFESYSQSKLAQVLFSAHLNNLLLSNKDSSWVQSHSVHPGVVNTELFDGTIIKKLVPWAIPIFFKTTIAGAMPIVHACISDELEGNGGTYINNCQIQPVSKRASDKILQEKLFSFSEKLVGITTFGGNR